MKILGNTPEGDLIIQVSQVQWDRLVEIESHQDVIRPKNNQTTTMEEEWQETEAGKFLAPIKAEYGRLALEIAFRRNEIDGSIQSLWDLAEGRIKLHYIRDVIRDKLKKVLNRLDNPAKGGKIEWAFEPKLGYEIEPTLTEEEFDDILTRVAGPVRGE